MKIILAVFFIAVIAAGCKKSGDVKPTASNSTTTSDNTATSGTSTTPPGTTSNLTHDDSIHMALFNITPQAVSTNVSGVNLTLIFNENVNLLFTATAYQQTSAVHLTEDFKNTLLAGFDYTTVAEGGNITLNWVDDNLNNVILKTIEDTVINKVNMVKINVHRQFTFFKVYASNQAALAQQAVFINKKDDTIAFSSYSYYNQKNYPVVSGSAKLVYLE